MPFGLETSEGASMKNLQKFSCLSLLALFAVSVNVPSRAELISQLGVLDLEANGGINPATGAAWAVGDKYRLAFVTEATTLASSTDIATYNSFVQSEAAASTAYTDLGTVSWNAIASTSSVNALVNTGTNPDSSSSVAVFLMDGSTIFASNNADIWDVTATKWLNRTQNNISRQGNLPNTSIWGSWTAVWTGTGGNGTASNPLGNGTSVRLGLMAAEPKFWMSRSTNDGTTVSLPMYAMSEELVIVPEPASLILVSAGSLLLIAYRRR
jgi:hypothetical protein